MSVTENSADANTVDEPKKPLPDESLPPVEAPTAGFILQLFLIPMIIVSIIALVFVTIHYLAHMGSNPRDLVQGLQKGDDAAWQKALNLAEMLRDPQQEDLKHDRELARELASVLRDQMADGATNENQIKLRIFVCRAIGEFKVDDGLPALLEAAATERDAADIEPQDKQGRKLHEIDVRRAAIEAIAVLTNNLGAEDLRDNTALFETLLEASRSGGDPDAKDEYLRAELRSTAAYALGVLGGEEALDRLDFLQHNDRSANTRYNAATGLARHGDERAVHGLLEMLDPDNEKAVEDELFDSGKPFKRTLVLRNGIQAAATLAQRNKSADLSALEQTLVKLRETDLNSHVQVKVDEALQVLAQRETAAVSD